MKDIQLFNDSFQNYKSYQKPKAQLILTDVPYVLGKNAYASNPVWLVIDPCAGSGTTLLAAANMKRKAYGFEVNKKFCADADQKVLKRIQHNLFV